MDFSSEKKNAKHLNKIWQNIRFAFFSGKNDVFVVFSESENSEKANRSSLICLKFYWTNLVLHRKLMNIIQCFFVSFLSVTMNHGIDRTGQSKVLLADAQEATWSSITDAPVCWSVVSTFPGDQFHQ